MGTGSSKGHRRRWRASRRGSSSRHSGSISISSAPAGQGQPEGGGGGGGGGRGGGGGGEGPAAPEGRVPSHQAPPPAAPAEEPDWVGELLDQVLAEGRRRGGADGDGEEEEEEEEEEGPRLPPRLPAGPSSRLDAGDSWPPPEGGDGGEGLQVFLPRTTPESSKFDNEHPLKDPERQGNITYDYSEEELMASIEQEYCG